MKRVPTLLGPNHEERGNEMTQGTGDREENEAVIDVAGSSILEADDVTGEAAELAAEPASVERPAAERTADRASEGAARARRAAAATASFVSENALALGLVGISAGWLALNMGRQRRTGARQQPAAGVQGVASRSRDVVSEYPMAVGALAVATGVGLAMVLPETQVENRMLHPVARKLADEARGLADHVRADLQSAREAAGELRDALMGPPVQADA